MESPPSEANAKDYRAQALTSTILHARLSDLSSKQQDHCVTEIPRRGRTSGRLRTVEVELEFETPSLWPPKEATLLCSAQKEVANIVGRARCVRSDGDFVDSSEGCQTARKLLPIKLFALNSFANSCGLSLAVILPEDMMPFSSLENEGV
jgi:hypothetical protein